MIFTGCVHNNDILIKGNVLINHKLNYEDFEVALYEGSNEKPSQVEEINEDGTFEMQIERDGQYILRVESKSGNNYKSNEIAFSIVKGKIDREEEFNLIVSSERVEQTSSISLESATIKGKVKYPQDLNYVNIMVVLAHKVDGDGFKFFLINEDGNFEMNDIDDGIYYICARANQEISQWVKVELIDGSVVDDDEIILDLTSK